MPPANHLVNSAQLQVWSEAEPVRRAAAELALSMPLTKRESEVLGWLREGKTEPEIAIILGCARRTVESHVARIYRKIGECHRTRSPVDAFARNHVGRLSRHIEERHHLQAAWDSLAGSLREVSGMSYSTAVGGLTLGMTDVRIVSGIIRGEARAEIATSLKWRRDTLDRHLGGLRERLGFENSSQFLQALAALRPPPEREASSRE